MKRREVELRLALYDDLSDILRAMRSFALTELHRVARREEAQHEVLAAVTRAVDELAAVWPPVAPPRQDRWIVLGSVRGFCGAFNEDVLRAWQAARANGADAVVAGERMLALLPQDATVYPVAGAVGALDAPAAIDRILAALDVRRRAGSGEDDGLMVCFRDRDGARCKRLLPVQPGGKPAPPPLIQEAPGRLVGRMIEHYLFHALLATMLRSIRVENQMRLMQMENALQHIGRSSEELHRRRNRLRQEEIVEEIEVMVTKPPALHGLRRLGSPPPDPPHA